MGKRSKGKEARKERALERTEVSSQRTPEEQLQRLDHMFGDGQGAAKERMKLAKKIDERNRLATQANKKVEEKPELPKDQPENEDTEPQHRKKSSK